MSENITKKYQGFSKTIDVNGKHTSEKYVGTKAQCEAFAADYAIGVYSEYGSLTSISIEQDDGCFWTVSLEWSTQTDSEGNEVPTGSSYGPAYSTLNVRMMTMPLEVKKGYRTHWNYILAAKRGVTGVPEFWKTTKGLTFTDEDAEKYKWVSSPSEIPQGWKALKDKTKPRS